MNNPQADELTRALDSHIEALNEVARLKRMSNQRQFIFVLVLIPTLIIGLIIVSINNKDASAQPKFSSAEKLINSGDYQDAIKVLEVLYAKNPNDYIAIQEIARCYVKIGKYEKAKEYWAKARLIFPNNCNEVGLKAVEQVLHNSIKLNTNDTSHNPPNKNDAPEPATPAR